ncbi:YqaJ viral recombinase family protein [Rhodococcus artemisiae]|uniref:YqaJ viral recombinase family protein n=1 Tax=Rhodococcus artemisiae TaxID=714159 RepID=A0ABU7LBM7_9NOCA|nr:YqaJ viral recombinase family protein [Rhodococcus artemisiae]MEE2058948.1 YqaJ viral recombinase family protein [Rhodococcus artemisiae]
MKMPAIVPGSPEWQRMVTASKVPAILGISRWQSQFALWHEMAGAVEPAPVTTQSQDMFDYGHAVELAAGEYWKYRNPGWKLSPGEVQFHLDDLAFPNAATVDRRASRGRARKIVEIKSARSLEEWGDDGSGEAPADYTAQVIWQMLISGIHQADIVLWPEYGRPRIYPIEWDPEVADDILKIVYLWVASISAGTPPDLDDTITTYECVRRLHPDIERDLEVELDEVLAVEYLTATAQSKTLDKELRGLKTRVLDAMGNAQFAMCRGHKIADRRNGRGDSISLYASKPTFIEEYA